MSFIRKIQLMELKILNEVVSICEKNNLKYFFIGGTLLGAVRHCGFIPWDDDIDIVMPREDYSIFLSICASELPSFLTLQYQETEPNYWLPFAKIRLRNTLINIEHSNNPLQENGLYIDIFPLDCSHGLTKTHERIKGWTLNVLKKMALDSITEVKSRRHAIFIFALKLFHIKTKNILNLHERIAKKGKGNYIVDYGSYYGYTKTTMPKEFFLPATELEFEGRMYSVPGQPKKLLEQVFGSDYMQLPPPDQRITHDIDDIRFFDDAPNDFIEIFQKDEE